MKQTLAILLMILFSLSAFGATITGELKQWHCVTLDFEGPETSENAPCNPFLNYRLDVTFSQGEKSYIVPGYFAADGTAGESSAVSGNVWRVHFAPDAIGTWEYSVSFKHGKNAAVAASTEKFEDVSADGETGSFKVAATDKKAPDFRALGKLSYVGERYLKFAGSGDYFIKAGADSPENFLGYTGFDGTYYGGNNVQRQGEDAPNAGLHQYAAHLKDWKEGDPAWQDGRGKEMIGALNYLAGKGMNSVYFLTMNVMGDGDDVWPWTERNERYRFDCSKLDQWEIVFSHMEKLGLMMHVVLQETENELLLDIGKTETQRKLYLRELAARFAHHNAIKWNLGEENGYAHFTPHAQDDDMRKAMADGLKAIDPYDHYLAIHTHSTKKERDEVMTPLLGHPTLDGVSLQVADPKNVPDVTIDWINQSADSAHQWVVALDEIGHYTTGVKPDKDDYWHDEIRKYPLWGHLMRGGAGSEWYFGYKYAHADLNCEDWQSRDHMWDLTRYAKDFFVTYLPFEKMTSQDSLITVKQGFCFAKKNEIYAVYLMEGGTTELDLGDSKSKYSVKWYNPRHGGKLVNGSVKSVKGPGRVLVGMPPEDKGKDWVVLVKKK